MVNKLYEFDTFFGNVTAAHSYGFLFTFFLLRWSIILKPTRPAIRNGIDLHWDGNLFVRRTRIVQIVLSIIATTKNIKKRPKLKIK